MHIIYRERGEIKRTYGQTSSELRQIPQRRSVMSSRSDGGCEKMEFSDGGSEVPMLTGERDVQAKGVEVRLLAAGLAGLCKGESWTRGDRAWGLGMGWSYSGGWIGVV